MAQMREQINTPEKELRNEEIDNRCRVQITVIRMFTEMIEYGHEIKEDVKPRQSEKKQNIQGREGKGREYTNSEGKETDSNQ